MSTRYACRERLLRWLEANRPDVLCLQELKATDAHFPHEAVRAAEYDGAVLGQKPGAIDRIGSICRRRKSRRPSPTPR